MLDNPVTLKPDYHGFILSRLSSLVYLDYRRVNPAEIQAALEQHQVCLLQRISLLSSHALLHQQCQEGFFVLRVALKHKLCASSWQGHS